MGKEKEPGADELASRELENKLWGTSVCEDGVVVPVNLSDMKSVWQMQRQAVAKGVGSKGGLTAGTQGVMVGLSAYKGVCSPGANIGAIWYRVSMLELCEIMGLLSAY